MRCQRRSLPREKRLQQRIPRVQKGSVALQSQNIKPRSVCIALCRKTADSKRAKLNLQGGGGWGGGGGGWGGGGGGGGGGVGGGCKREETTGC